MIAILPCTNIPSATGFFVRLGYNTPSETEKAQWGDYLILNYQDAMEIHLRQISADEEGWLQPERNSFGIYLRTTKVEVDRLAAEFADEIIEGGKKAEVKEWGMYEFSLNGPDGCLVRVGCPAG